MFYCWYFVTGGGSRIFIKSGAIKGPQFIYVQYPNTLPDSGRSSFKSLLTGQGHFRGQSDLSCGQCPLAPPLDPPLFGTWQHNCNEEQRGQGVYKEEQALWPDNLKPYPYPSIIIQTHLPLNPLHYITFHLADAFIQSDHEGTNPEQ